MVFVYGPIIDLIFSGFFFSERGAASCLDDVQSKRRPSYMNLSKKFKGLPGRFITADEQCKQQYGEGSRHCKYKQVNKK